jgi:anti-sigma B factor antagonist
MAEVTDPLPADRGGIDGAEGLGMSTRQCAGQVVVALSGELDVTDALRICALVTTVAIGVPWLIVDLAALNFTDCAGMRALEATARQAGGGLVLAAPGPTVLRVLDLTGLITKVLVHSQRRRGSPGSIAPASRAGLSLNQTRGLSWPGCHCQARTPAGRRAALAPTSSPPRLTRAPTARDRTGRPRPVCLQGTR